MNFLSESLDVMVSPLTLNSRMPWKERDRARRVFSSRLPWKGVLLKLSLPIFLTNGEKQVVHNSLRLWRG